MQPSASAGRSRAIGLFYFFFFGGLGAFFPFVNLYLQETGKSGMQIGVLNTLAPLVMLFSQPFWGTVCDRYNRRREVLTGLCAAGACVALLLPAAGAFAALAVLFALLAFVVAPIAPIADAVALEHADTERSEYGRLRVYGSIGFALTALITGRLLSALGTVNVFYVYAGCLLAAALVTRGMPAGGSSFKGSSLAGVSLLLREARFRTFLVAVFLFHVAYSAYHLFFGIYLYALGIDRTVIGLAFMLAAGSEIPLMYFSGRVVARLGAAPVVAAAIAVYAGRWLLYALVRDPGIVLAAQLAHGICFGLGYAAMVSFIHAAAPAGLRTSAQTVFWAVSFGGGAIAGNLLFGRLFDLLGVFRIFGVAFALGMGSVALVLVLLRAERRRRPLGDRPSTEVSLHARGAGPGAPGSR